MKKVCIFKVWGGRHWYRVCRVSISDGCIAYEVFRGRKHIAGIWMFFDFETAADIAVSLAKANVYFISDGEDVQ